MRINKGYSKRASKHVTSRSAFVRTFSCHFGWMSVVALTWPLGGQEAHTSQFFDVQQEDMLKDQKSSLSQGPQCPLRNVPLVSGRPGPEATMSTLHREVERPTENREKRQPVVPCWHNTTKDLKLGGCSCTVVLAVRLLWSHSCGKRALGLGPD